MKDDDKLDIFGLLQCAIASEVGAASPAFIMQGLIDCNWLTDENGIDASQAQSQVSGAPAARARRQEGVGAHGATCERRTARTCP